MTENRCPIDHRETRGDAKICEKCSQETRVRLAEIPALYIEAGAYLVPGKGGFGSSGSERTIGVNLAALGFRQAAEVLGVLQAWEIMVCEESEVVRASETGTIQERVEAVCLFLLKHAQWLACHEAAKDWVEEVAKIHSQGEVATRRFTEKVTRIKCPTSIEEFIEGGGEIAYRYCGQTLTLGKDPLDIVECRRCHTEWTTLWLVRVAMTTPGYVVWMDSEAIGELLGIGAKQVAKIARKYHAQKRGKRGFERYDLMEMSTLRERSRHADNDA